MNTALSLRTKLILAFVGIAIISIAVVAVNAYLMSRSAITNQAGNTLYTLAQSQAVTVGNEIVKQLELMVSVGHSRSLQEGVNAANAKYRGDEASIRAKIDELDLQWRAADAADNNADPLVESVLSNALAAELLGFQKSFPEHIEVFVTDKYGASVASTGRTSDYNQADEDWWQTTYHFARGAFYIGQPEYDDSTRSFAVNLGVPVRNDETGETIGVLRSTFNLQGFNQILAVVRFGATGNADLIFPSGEMIGSKTAKSSLDPAVLAQLRGVTDSYGIFDYRDQERVVSQAKVNAGSSNKYPISGLLWYLVVYQNTAEILQPVQAQTRSIASMSLGVLLLATILALFAGRALANPITRLTAAANTIAGGNLDVQAKVESKDEIGELAATFNQMTGQLRQMVEKEQAQRKYLQETIAQYANFTAQVMQGKLRTRLPVSNDRQSQADPLVKLGNSLNEMTANLQHMIARTRETVNNLGSASTEILASTTQQATGAAEQSAAIQQTTTTANEIKTISEQSAMRLTEITNASQYSVDATHAGQKSMQAMTESMARIKERVESIAQNTLALAEQTQQIGEIISTVNEIAEQSNMLALNASVEAARAGEQGKGFAVVAMEVRSLAEQSKQATAQISAILSKIQKATNATVMATEGGSKGVDEGTQLAAQARESIEVLNSAVNEATQVASQVALSGQQLKTGIDQIAIAIQQVSQVTMQSLASTRQTEKAAQALNDLARQLDVDISQYEV